MRKAANSTTVEVSCGYTDTLMSDPAYMPMGSFDIATDQRNDIDLTAMGEKRFLSIRHRAIATKGQVTWQGMLLKGQTAGIESGPRNMPTEVYGIERSILLPDIPAESDQPLLRYLIHQRTALIAAYDELARRLNELSFEEHWGSVTPTQIVANTIDYDLGTAIVHRMSTDASRNITGFVAPLIERMDTIINTGSFNIVLVHQAASYAGEPDHVSNGSRYHGHPRRARDDLGTI